MKAWLAVVLLLLASIVATCTGSGSSAPSASPSPSPSLSSSPSPSPGASQTGHAVTQVQIKLRLLEELGELWYCDPDFYPVARADEQRLADERLPEIQLDKPTYEAILGHLAIAAGTALTRQQRLTVYRTWKQVNAIQLAPAGTGYRFDILVRSGPSAEQGRRVVGTVDERGSIHIEQQAPSGPPPCPICLARGTLIATSAGSVPVEDLQPGTAVWTQDAAGRRMEAVVLKVGSTPVPSTHRVVHLTLADGRQLWVSPGHPLPDGRRVGQLRAGDRIDGTLVLAATLSPYTGGATFDLLPSGPTGTYWANGIPLASTLRP